LAEELKSPLLRVDDLFEIIPTKLLANLNSMWDELVGMLLALVEIQLEIGLSVVVDSVFMGEDRAVARKLAEKYGAEFLPIYTYVSDVEVWKQRVCRRVEEAPPEDEVATWDRIQIQQRDFWTWEPGTALFVDSIEPFEQNWTKVLTYLNTSWSEVK
jgi:hypothetical protein